MTHRPASAWVILQTHSKVSAFLEHSIFVSNVCICLVSRGLQHADLLLCASHTYCKDFCFHYKHTANVPALFAFVMHDPESAVLGRSAFDCSAILLQVLLAFDHSTFVSIE